MFLSTLLPGLREVRAPLLAGWLWLVVVFLVWGPDLDVRVQGRDVAFELGGSQQRAPLLAVFGVLSLGAYLVGSLVGDVLRGVWRQWRELSDVSTWGWGQRPQASTTPYAQTSLRLLLEERVAEAEVRLRAGGETLAALPATLASSESEWEPHGPTWLDDEEHQAQQLASALHAQTLRELGLVRFRLMGDEPALFAQVDRSQSEAEFRIAAATPILAIGLLVAVGMPGVVTALLVAASAAAFAGLLAWQAVSRQREANDALVDALFIGKVQAPALDQLRRATDEVLTESPEQRAVRLAKVEAEKRRRDEMGPSFAGYGC